LFKPPTGYESGVQQGIVPYTVQDGLDDVNIINVLYPKKTYPVTIKYYKDSETEEFTPPYTLYPDRVYESTVALDSSLLNRYRPTMGYTEGVGTSTPVYTVHDDNGGTNPNIIEVRYFAKPQIAQIVYHKDSATGPEIGRSEILPDFVYSDEITQTSALLNAFKPAGYEDGRASEAVWTIEDKTINLFSVYYPRTPLANNNAPVSVRYEKQLPDGSYSFIATDTVAGDWLVGDSVILTPTQINAHQTSGYETGTLITPTPFTVTATGTNELVVRYDLSSVMWEVAYYKALPEGGRHYLGHAPSQVGTYSAELTTAELSFWRDYLKPGTGYKSGTVTTTLPFTLGLSGSNIIEVLYEPATYDYTVNYYKVDDASTFSSYATGGILLGSATVRGAFFGDSTLLQTGSEEGQTDWKRPSGYHAGVQTGDSTVDEDTVVNVIYLKAGTTTVSPDSTPLPPLPPDIKLDAPTGDSSAVALAVMVTVIASICLSIAESRKKRSKR
ncbi:MAG: hypothetical protein LBJ07_01815, partial [Actinomycetes bacterium]|nr:hypothetical protein [Actinomycetes bacterium]